MNKFNSILACTHIIIQLTFGESMRKKPTLEYSDEDSDVRKYTDENNVDDGAEGTGKSDKKSNDEYKCGKADCGKLYHSYTAFYNHCKKSHEGVFPQNSLYNNKPFEGPSKNRGRPRIRKTDVKDSIQIQSLKTENELIEFLGTLPKKKKNQQLITYVSNPLDQLDKAIETVCCFKKDILDQLPQKFLYNLRELNRVVSQNDLPDFYDPIQIIKYSDKMDSYNFLSIFNFMTHSPKGIEYARPNNTILFLRKILIVWLTRIISVPVLAEVIYTIAQIIKGVERIEQREYMQGKTLKFKQLIDKYFDCVLKQQYNQIQSESKQQLN